MLLTNSKYDSILREYDYRNQKNKHNLSLRKEELYKEIPELNTLEDELISASIQLAKLSLFQDISTDSLKKTMSEIHQKKISILRSHGYPSDYLDPIYDCKDCKDTGFVENKKCICFKHAIINEIYAQSNLDKILEKENFNHFSLDYYDNRILDPNVRLTPRQNMENMYDIAQNFINNFNTKHENLIITGYAGVGKTFLANCIAKELLDQGHTVIYLTAFGLFDLFGKVQFKGTEDAAHFQAQFDYILDCDLLIIDDLGTELNNTFVNVQLYLCINERYLRNKSTIISTNYNLNDLKTMYSDRIFSRIASNYTLLKIIGDDIRFKKLF